MSPWVAPAAKPNSPQARALLLTELILLLPAPPGGPVSPRPCGGSGTDGVPPGKQGSGENPTPLSLQVKDGPGDGGCRLLDPARALPAPHRRAG